MKGKTAAGLSDGQRRLLLTRVHVAELLGCSTSTVIRLQREGRLRGVRLSRRPTGQVYFKLEDVLALVEGTYDAG
jgi:excisionase family DNA binding protein